MSDTILRWPLVGFSDPTRTGRCCSFAFHLSAAPSPKNDPLAFRTRVRRNTRSILASLVTKLITPYDPIISTTRSIGLVLECRTKTTKRKKGIIMKKLLTLICLAFVAYAQAQTNTTSSTTTSSPGTTSNTTSTSSTSNTSGRVTDYTPGAAIVIDPGTGQPVHFIIGKAVEIITPDGKVIKAADIKKNAKVRVHMVPDGDRTVVDQIIVDEAK
jgi:hypothetical protein